MVVLAEPLHGRPGDTPTELRVTTIAIFNSLPLDNDPRLDFDLIKTA
jgi:hypothetical protein